MPHPMLKVVKDVLKYVTFLQLLVPFCHSLFLHFSSRELTVFTDLVQAQLSISEWDFLPALLNIQSANERLHAWKGIHVLDNQVSKTPSLKVMIMDSFPARTY